MQTRLWRQRRRLILLFVLCACAVLIADGRNSFAAAFQFSAIAVIAASVALIALPDTRWFLFKAAALAPIAAVLSLAAPLWMVVTISVAGLVFLPSQPWTLDRVRIPGICKARRRITVRLDARTLWHKVFPRETNDHWDPYIRGIRSGGTSDTFFLVYEALSQAGELQVPFKIFDVESGTHFKSRDLSQPDAAEGGPVIVTSYVIEASGDHSTLTLMEAIWRPMLWTAFSQWLDDYLGDHTDRLAALLEGRRDWSLKGASLRSLADRAEPSGFAILQKG